MSSRRPTRALIALATPVLAVTLAVPASAAPAKGPDVPGVEQVAALYPHLEGGVADVMASTIHRIEDDCSEGGRVPGARGTSALYDVDATTQTDPYVLRLVTVSAASFRSARQASAYLRALVDEDCLGVAEEDRTRVRKIRFGLGDQRAGLVITMQGLGAKNELQQLVVRTGRRLVLVGVSWTEGQAPPVKQAIRLAALALRTAR